MRRMVSIFLVLVMVLSAVPFGAFATETMVETEPVLMEESVTEPDVAPVTEQVEETEPNSEAELVQETVPTREVVSVEIPFTINPLYEGIYTAADFSQIERPDDAVGEADDHGDLDFWHDQELLYAPNYLTIEEAVEELKQHMINREETFTLYFKAKTSRYNEHLTQMFLNSFVHTGKPTEGDYLQWHFAGWGGYIDYSWIGGECCFKFDAEIAYLTNADQEWELNGAVNALLNTVAAEGNSDYQKIKAVYDYICENVTYDYANLNDETYLLKHSAYAALVDKTAVCQGYATLFYRMMLEMGIDCRVIPGLAEDGSAHSWNIVKIGDVYYNLDATWDAGYDEYYWFLCNTINFPYHYRYMEYATTQFHTDYPMAAENYTEGSEGVADEYIVIGVCGDEVAFGIDRERNLVIAGNGPMWDYESITSGNEANYPTWYYWMDAFDHVIIEEGVTNVGDYAFYTMSHITDISLPETLVEIGDFAFGSLGQLETILLPTALETIGNNAFTTCKKLVEITIPNGVKSIGNGAFANCSALNNVTFNENLVSIGNQAFQHTALTEVILPSGVTTLGASAFANCNQLATVSFGNALQTIGDQAFRYTALTEAILPSGVTTLGASAFANCNQLATVSLGNALQTIGSSAFYYCNQLDEIVLPNTLTEIGSNAFQYCSIVEIIIPDSVTSLGSGAFGDCYNLQSVVWNNRLTSIPSETFRNCNSLTSFEFLEHVKTIDSYAFAGAGFEEIVIPDTVESIANGAFSGCRMLRSAKFNNQLTRMEDELFSYCVKLESIDFPENVEYIGSRVFSQCAGLITIEIPDHVMEIGEHAFDSCSKLEKITFPDSLISLGDFAFYECTALNDLVLPDNLQSIEKNTFSTCSGLKDVTLPKNLRTLEDYAFYLCSSLEEIDIPSGVISIGSDSFASCYSLKHITIPETVKSVGSNAFSRCTVLEEIVFLGDAPTFGIEALGNPVFRQVTATAYYPIGNETWTEDVLKDYGGDITWIASCVTHDYSDVQVIAPTCTEEGYTRHSCPVCKQGYTTDEIEKLGHDLSDWVVDVAETCTTDGSKTRACRREGCDYSETEVIPATGHSHEAVVTAPTCEKGGFTTHTCHCGDSYITDELAALGHDVTYAVNTAPTLEVEGAISGVCGRCGDTITQILPKLNKQDYTLEVFVEPTKEAEGFGKYTWNVTEYGEFVFEGAISNVILGDVNDDGAITVLDLMRLANFFAGKDVEVNEANADVNDDGKVTVLDLMRLANYFAGKAELG